MARLARDRIEALEDLVEQGGRRFRRVGLHQLISNSALNTTPVLDLSTTSRSRATSSRLASPASRTRRRSTGGGVGDYLGHIGLTGPDTVALSPTRQKFTCGNAYPYGANLAIPEMRKFLIIPSHDCDYSK